MNWKTRRRIAITYDPIWYFEVARPFGPPHKPYMRKVWKRRIEVKGYHLVSKNMLFCWHYINEREWVTIR